MMSDNRLTLMKAITSQSAVTAVYNGAMLKLAPHLLFERHGDLFVSAENLGKATKDEGDRRLGQFKLAGLGSIELLEEPFTPVSFPVVAPRPEDTVILAV